MQRISVRVLVCAVLTTVAASSAVAGVGLQAGLSLSPDDFVIGVHFKPPTLAKRISIVPSVEAGFGDATMVAGNLDGHFLLATTRLAPYLGAGLTVNWVDYDGGSSTDFGGSLLGGIQLTKHLYFETKVGLGDVPDWKFLVGASL